MDSSVAGAPGVTVRRLGPEDAEAFHALRVEGFTRHPLLFRYSPGDEVAVSMDAVRARLASEFVVGAEVGGVLSGIGGFSRLAGEKLRHKGLLLGMYVRGEARGLGLGDLIVDAIVRHAREHVELLQLTVMADNPRAIKLYTRWGFEPYGTEQASVKVGDRYLDELLIVKRL
jgi:ribosomal protein S18 acetylase RimI-like enzyme